MVLEIHDHFRTQTGNNLIFDLLPGDPYRSGKLVHIRMWRGIALNAGKVSDHEIGVIAPGLCAEILQIGDGQPCLFPDFAGDRLFPAPECHAPAVW